MLAESCKKWTNVMFSLYHKCNYSTRCLKENMKLIFHSELNETLRQHYDFSLL